MICSFSVSVSVSTWSSSERPTTLRTVVCAISTMAVDTSSISTMDFTGSTRRKYVTAATPMETLSRVMTCCEGIGMVTVRSVTLVIRSASGIMNRIPGSRTLRSRPNRNTTPRWYCRTIATPRLGIATTFLSPLPGLV